MDTEIKNAASVAGKDAQYDGYAKRLLGNKIILAHILVNAISEFHGTAPEDAVSYIEGDPLIGVVPVEPGLTNAVEGKHGRQRIVGMNTENMEINEGLVRFDIVFYVRMKDGLSQVIVNVEAQKGEPTGYDILDRAVFYACRLVSSQKERDFAGMNYSDIRRVYSIWVCMNMEGNSMDYVHLTDDKLMGAHPWKGGLDLVNIVMVGIARELPGQDEGNGLHRLLGALLSMELSVDEKLGIMETEYRIPLGDSIRKDVGAMCNLSQGIREDGIAIGEARGKVIGEAIGEAKKEAEVIVNMHKNGFTLEQIALATNRGVEEVREVIENGTPVRA